MNDLQKLRMRQVLEREAGFTLDELNAMEEEGFSAVSVEEVLKGHGLYPGDPVWKNVNAKGVKIMNDPKYDPYTTPLSAEDLLPNDNDSEGGRDTEPTIPMKRPRRPVNYNAVAAGLGAIAIVLLVALLWRQGNQATWWQTDEVGRNVVEAKTGANGAMMNDLINMLDKIRNSVVYTDPNGNKKSVADLAAEVAYEVSPKLDNPIIRRDDLDNRMKRTERLVSRRTSKKYLVSVMTEVPAPAVASKGRTLYLTFEPENKPAIAKK